MRALISERLSEGEPAQTTRRQCLTCLGRFLPLRPWQVYCSDKCRFTHRAAREFAEALRTGRAEGLRDLVRELAAPAEEGR